MGFLRSLEKGFNKYSGIDLAKSGFNTLTGKDAADAAGRASALQSSATDRATAENARQFDIGQANLTPWLSAGKGALSAQQELMGLGGYDSTNSLTALQNSPGYKFRLQQGLGGIENSASARGGLYSGATMKALNDYGSDYAANEYGNRYNQLANLSGTGQATGAGLAAQGMNYANNQGNLWTNMANAQGAAGIAGANARQSGLQNILGLGATAYGAKPYGAKPG